MPFISKIFKKYKISLLLKIFIFELKYLCVTKEIPLFDLKPKKNKKYNLSISTPFYFINFLSKNLKNKVSSIFIDFGCGDGKVIRFLKSKNIFRYYYGYELEKKLVNDSKKKLNSNNVKFIYKNLFFFRKNETIFSIIKKKNINTVYLYFYNPFDLKVISRIINYFSKIRNLYIIVLGFEKSQVNKLKKLIKFPLKISIKHHSLYIFNNAK